MSKPFHCIYSHGFIRAAVAVPFVRVADPFYNLERILGLARRASEQQAAIALFPELGLSAYSNEDLFHQDVLLDATEDALATLIMESRDLQPVLLVARRCVSRANCSIARWSFIAGGCSGLPPRPICPTTGNFTKNANSLPGVLRSVGRCFSRENGFRSALI